MKISLNIKTPLILMMVIFLTTSCEDYLAKKPDQALVIPNDLNALQALMDYDRQKMNQDLALGFIGSDNYFIPYQSWQTLYTNVERNSYIWAPDIYELEPGTDWQTAYEQVFISNVVLENLENIPITANNRNEWEKIRGSALFYRSYAFYNLLQYFAMPYDPETADHLLGIPLRLASKLDAPIFRENLLVCYQEVLQSLEKAADILPIITDYKTRPSKAAAYACLARVNLIMKDYKKAENYASSCLDLFHTLLNYNDFDTTAIHPFDAYNEEVIFHSVSIPYNIFTRAEVVPELYGSYADGDLRKSMFYGEGNHFKGWYASAGFPFTGLAVDEIYLIRAECRARLNDVEGAMDDLNTLLNKRWDPALFVEYTANNVEDALGQILQERRKELAFRGLRWSDLRRLNHEPRFAITLRREWPAEGINYSLPPNDPRYVYPIPYEEIEISKIEQNVR